MLERVVILGARENGHGKVVLETFRAMGNVQVIGFLDDAPHLLGKQIGGVSVIGNIALVATLASREVTGAIAATGDPQSREAMARAIIDSGLGLANCIHPSAILADGASCGRGVFIGPNAVIVSGASIGDSVIVNTAATVDHDCVVDDYATLCPGVHLSGRVTVRRGAFLGTGAIAIPDVEIGEWSVVGAGAVVVRNVPPGVTVAGVPAAPMPGPME